MIDEAVGTRRLYRLNPTGLAAMRAYFDRFWNRALTAFADEVERSVTSRDAPGAARPTRSTDGEHHEQHEQREQRVGMSRRPEG